MQHRASTQHAALITRPATVLEGNGSQGSCMARECQLTLEQGLLTLLLGGGAVPPAVRGCGAAAWYVGEPPPGRRPDTSPNGGRLLIKPLL